MKKSHYYSLGIFFIFILVQAVQAQMSFARSVISESLSQSDSLNFEIENQNFLNLPHQEKLILIQKFQQQVAELIEQIHEKNQAISEDTLLFIPTYVTQWTTGPASAGALLYGLKVYWYNTGKPFKSGALDAFLYSLKYFLPFIVSHFWHIHLTQRLDMNTKEKNRLELELKKIQKILNSLEQILTEHS